MRDKIYDHSSERLNLDRSLLRSELVWTQPEAMVHWWALRMGNDLVGTLSYIGWAGFRAELQLAENTWRFSRRGFFQSRVEIHSSGMAGADLVFSRGWFMHGELTSYDGSVLNWRPIDFWRMKWAFFDSTGQPLVQFTSGLPNLSWRNLFRQQATIHISPRGQHHQDLGLLLGLGWYLMLWYRAAAAAGAAAGSYA